MRFSNRKLHAAWIAGIILAAACALSPIHDRLWQAGFFIGLVTAWAAARRLLENRRLPRLVLTGIPLLAVVPFLLPGKPLDAAALRDDYVGRLVSYEGTRYVWGGENSLGIDCSGLPRRALRDALWAQGVRHANGTAFRMWLDQWWFDEGAHAMGQGYRGQTRGIGVSGPLWEMSHLPLQPGDLAVKSDANHVVVYLGNGEWIEADPTMGKVHRWVSKPEDGPWYEHMTAHRWAVLCQPESPEHGA